MRRGNGRAYSEAAKREQKKIKVEGPSKSYHKCLTRLVQNKNKKSEFAYCVMIVRHTTHTEFFFNENKTNLELFFF